MTWWSRGQRGSKAYKATMHQVFHWATSLRNHFSSVHDKEKREKKKKKKNRTNVMPPPPPTSEFPGWPSIIPGRPIIPRVVSLPYQVSVPVQRAFCSSSSPPFHRFQTLPLSPRILRHSCTSRVSFNFSFSVSEENSCLSFTNFFFFFLGAGSDRFNRLHAKGGPLYAGSVSAGGFAVDATAGEVDFFSN
jgi:hypothetical protein